jgi:SPP1 family predicted phage head-tail adaptor
MAKRNLPLGGAIPMEPGERDRPVTIQQRATTDTVDDSGFPTDNGAGWTTLASSVWMRKLDLKGQERFQANQLSAPFDTQWEMGYRADMDPELLDVPKLRRLLYQGRSYDIVAASHIGLREGVELMTLAAPR